MHEDLWFTALLNEFLPGPANFVRSLPGQLFGLDGFLAEDAAHPWTNYMAMEILVVLFLLSLPVFFRKWSVDRPGKVQQTFELMWEFLSGQAHDVIGHAGVKHMALFGTLFLFILSSNLLGLIPSFESPTMYVAVPLGCALLTFVYYQLLGFKEQGAVGYMKHFTQETPWWIAWFIFVVEIISHFVRPLSLSVRLYANMLAGEQVTLTFLALVPLGVPLIFMGLHAFVALIQAFIFVVLAMAYVSGSVAHEEH